MERWQVRLYAFRDDTDELPLAGRRFHHRRICAIDGDLTNCLNRSWSAGHLGLSTLELRRPQPRAQNGYDTIMPFGSNKMESNCEFGSVRRFAHHPRNGGGE